MRFAWGCLGLALLWSCGTDTFGTDDGGGDSSAGPDSSGDAVSKPDGGDASSSGGDAMTDGPANNTCPFDGGVQRPIQCSGTGGCGLFACCIDADAGTASCGTAVCLTPDSFACFDGKDCSNGGACCLTYSSLSTLCPHDVRSPASTACQSSCNSPTDRVCVTDGECGAGKCEAAVLEGFKGYFSIGLCR